MRKRWDTQSTKVFLILIENVEEPLYIHCFFVIVPLQSLLIQGWVSNLHRMFLVLLKMGWKFVGRVQASVEFCEKTKIWRSKRMIHVASMELHIRVVGM